MRDSLSVVTLRPEQRDQRQLRHHDDDDQRGERPQCVHVVRGAETPASSERGAKSEPLDHGRSRGKPEEGEPGGGWEHGRPDEQRHRGEDEHRRRVRHQGRPHMVDEVARVDIRKRDQGAEREQHHRLDIRVVAERDLTRDGDRNAERQDAPEVPAVQRGSSRRPPDRRCAPRAGAVAAAQAWASSLIKPGRSSARSALASSKRHCRRSASPIAFASTRTSIAGTPASAAALSTA